MKDKVRLLKDPKTEAQHQSNVMKWSMAVRDKYPELALLYHIPNGGSRDQVEGRHLREQGVKPGVPDLCLPVGRGGYHGLYIEMKTKTGREEENQKWWRERLEAAGYFSTVCYGWESAVQTITSYLDSSPPRA